MCLENCSKRLRATEDIVCYKRLLISYTIDLKKVHGKPFVCTIKDIPVVGEISVNIEGRIYLCHDNPRFDGATAPNKFDHRYSWVMDFNVKDLVIDGEPMLPGYETPYKHAQVKLGETYTSKLKYFDGEVEEGLHSFVHQRDARNDGGGDIIECIIPKGSMYYKGTFGGDSAYASNKLTYVKKVE